MDCYREALNLDPEEAMAKERLKALTAAIEMKVCWSLTRGEEEVVNTCSLPVLVSTMDMSSW